MEPKEKMAAAMAVLGLTVSAEFVPFNMSRNATSEHPSLNWRVTLERNGKGFMTTDYMAGCAHAPSYRAKAPRGYAGSDSDYQRRGVARECQRGKRAKPAFAGSFSDGEPILPDSADVVWSLVQDASVLDHASFEVWAAEYGYEEDSRKAEAIYRACLDIALQMRAAIGDAGLEALREAGEDY